jgi:hypothetical protein
MVAAAKTSKAPSQKFYHYQCGRNDRRFKLAEHRYAPAMLRVERALPLSHNTLKKQPFFTAGRAQ